MERVFQCSDFGPSKFSGCELWLWRDSGSGVWVGEEKVGEKIRSFEPVFLAKSTGSSDLFLFYRIFVCTSTNNTPPAKSRRSRSPHPPNLLEPTQEYSSSRSKRFDRCWCPRGRILVGAVSCRAHQRVVSREEIRSAGGSLVEFGQKV